MKKISLILFCLITNLATSQSIEEELKSYCENSKYDELLIDLDQLQRSNLPGTDYKWHSKLEREIVNNFFEQTIQIDKEVENGSNSVNKTIYSFIIDLIRSENQIIYYKLSRIKYVRNKGFYEPRKIHISKKRNKPEVYELKSSFKNIYHANLSFNDLFETNIVFGDACGFGGTKPDYRVKLEKLVRKKDKLTIIKWIKSGTIEIQLYAIDGIYQLQNQGASFDPFFLSLINTIEDKKGKANTCTGCIYWDQSITEIVKRIKADNSVSN